MSGIYPHTVTLKFLWKNGKRITIQLPIETTAKYKAGNLLWIGGNYPSFQGGGTCKRAN